MKKFDFATNWTMPPLGSDPQAINEAACSMMSHVTLAIACLEVLLMAATKVGNPFDQFLTAIRYSSPLFSARQLDELRTKDGVLFRSGHI